YPRVVRTRRLLRDPAAGRGGGPLRAVRPERSRRDRSLHRVPDRAAVLHARRQLQDPRRLRSVPRAGRAGEQRPRRGADAGAAVSGRLWRVVAVGGGWWGSAPVLGASIIATVVCR